MPDDPFRLRQRLDEAAAFRIRASRDLEPALFEGADGRSGEVRVGEPWPSTVHPVRMRMHATVPDGWIGPSIRVQLDVGGEAMLRIEDRDVGGLDPNHVEHELDAFAAAGSRVPLDVTAVPYGPFGRRHAAPRLTRAKLILVDVGLEALWRELEAVHDAAIALAPTREAVAAGLAEAVRSAVALLPFERSPATAYRARMQDVFRSGATPDGGDLPTLWEGWNFASSPDEVPPPIDPSDVDAAQRSLWDAVAQLRSLGGPEGNLTMVGHTHIDLAWLWPLEETRRKVQRSFRTALATLRSEPDMVFAQASPQLYAFIEREDPEAFAEIRQRVDEGRWELLGGTWVEPDGNLPAGESWVRQLLLGQRYFQQRFGRRARVAWLPDTFGYAGNLPQLFAQGGLPYFFTTKLTWNDTNRFPHDLYHWEGLDGTRVLAHAFDNPDGGYNGTARGESVLATWRSYRGKRHHPTSLYTYGYGDGGGGPTREMLAAIRTYQHLPGMPRTRHGTVASFFDDVEGRGLPVWRGEKYLEYHRGTYTSQAATKAGNRRLEHELVEAEAAATLAQQLLERDYPRVRLEQAWTALLRNQFHDILPGSSVRSVAEEAEHELAQARDEAQHVRDAALTTLSRSVDPGARAQAALVIWNLSFDDRRLAFETTLPDDVPVELRDERGVIVPHARDGRRLVAACPDRIVPGLGYVSLTLHPASESPAVDARQGVSVDGTTLENRYLRATVGADGTIHALFDKVAERDVLDGRANQLWAHPDVPDNYDAWEIDRDYAAEGEELLASEPPSVLLDNGVEGAIRVVRRFGASTVVQDVRLTASAQRLEFATRIDWRERRTLLRAYVPLAVRSHEAWYETAFGAVPRPTHANTPWDAARYEVPGHRWADLSEADYGVSLLTDTKYGYSCHGGTLSLSLLRGPIFPDPLADEGQHAFRYALHPHQGDWRSGTVAEAHDLNAPLRCVRVEPAGDAGWPASARLIGLDAPRVRLAALKLHEDADEPLLRVYEPYGARGSVSIIGATAQGIEALTTLLEDDEATHPDPHRIEVTPYRVVTARLRLAPVRTGAPEPTDPNRSGP